MQKLTQASLFTGVGGCDLGYRNAGFEHAWGVEYDPKICEIANANFGGSVRCMNILDADPFKFEKVDVLHASPVCTSYSQANANKGEKQLDIDCAKKVCEFLRVLQPQYFTLENVAAYRDTRKWNEKTKEWEITAFGYIVETLNRLGYWSDYNILNSADFGVPQSRRRLILIANKSGFIPSLPPKEKHIGWYEVIADLVHDLPDSDLAPWQWKALPKDILKSLLIPTGNTSFAVKEPVELSFTLTAAHGGENVKAILLSQNRNNFSDSSVVSSKGEDPAFTLTASINNHVTRAILLENTGARSDRELQTRDAEEPCWTLRAMGQDGHYHRANALLIHPTDQRTMPAIEAPDPAFTLTSNQGGNHIKALLENAKIKALDTACLARLQSFPDDFVWSGVKSVDGKGIGNSCCPLKIEKIARSVIQ